MKINDQLVNVREEHKLISRFLVAYRTRHSIDLPNYLGDYEFSVVPRFLFTSDGKLYPTRDKSVVIRNSEQLMANVQLPPSDRNANIHQVSSVIIFDGMAIVNTADIKKSPDINKCID